MRRSLGAVIRGAVALVAVAAGSVHVAHAQDAPPTDEAPTATTPVDGAPPARGDSLVVVPAGCVVPRHPDIVFVGTLAERDYRTGRFRIEQVRDGDAGRFAVGGFVDVRYGNDVQYLALGDDYLVGAAVDPDLGILVSQIRAPAPPFGGDDVIAITESDEPCPVLEDPIRTLLPDGRSVESGVLAPFFDERGQIAGAFLVPLGVACAVIFALAALRLLFGVIGRGVGALVHPRR